MDVRTYPCCILEIVVAEIIGGGDGISIRCGRKVCNQKIPEKKKKMWKQQGDMVFEARRISLQTQILNLRLPKAVRIHSLLILSPMKAILASGAMPM